VWRVGSGGGVAGTAGGPAIGEVEGVSGALGVLVGCAGEGDAVASGDGGFSGSADRWEDFFRGVAPSCEDTTARSSSRPDEGESEVLFTSSSLDRCEGSGCGEDVAGLGARFTGLAGPRVRKHRRGAVLQSWHVLKL